MKLMVFEGSVEEIGQIVNGMQLGAIKKVQSEPDQADGGAVPPSRSEDGAQYVTVDFARRVLMRRPLSEPLLAVLRALYNAAPNCVAMSELLLVAGYGSGHQFAGLMGAFGRRKANTPGNDVEGEFFAYQENEDDGAWDYGLPDTVCEALEKEGLV